MATGARRLLLRLAMEPPLRLLIRAALLMGLPASCQTRALWDISTRPAYLMGVLEAAKQAIAQEIPAISVIEFGVGGGDGLATLQSEAEAVERHTGVAIEVYGFDRGGLPPLIGDYRDHPDVWQAGDYPMDESSVRSRLTARTKLIVGDVKDTLPRFFERFRPAPVGFVAFDMDLYSSTREALRIFTLADKQMLRHVPLYFDDIGHLFDHKYAGELLAIEEFNQASDGVKIDRWYEVHVGRPFPEQHFLERLYVAHDLAAISGTDRSAVSDARA